MSKPWLFPFSRMSSRRVGYFLCLLGFMWGLTLFNMSLMGSDVEKDTKLLKEEILQLSEKYVRSLAKETRNTIDGPYAGRLTGYDLKKTMAVLLEDVMERLDTMETRLNDALQNGSIGKNSLLEQNKQLAEIRNEIDNQRQAIEQGWGQPAGPNDLEQKPIDMKGLILGEQEDCSLTQDQINKFPHCKGKMEWMLSHWKSDKCYMEYGVDGSSCSVRVYLSEVENWCPLLPGRKAITFNVTKEGPVKDGQTQFMAKLNFDMDGLMAKLQDPGQRHNYAWMRMRIERMWKNWVDAVKNLAEKQDLSNRIQKKILVHLGLLSQKAGFKIAENSFRGGPLGELVQWSDIISVLYILGHDLTVTSEVEQLALILSQFPSAESQCQSRDRVPVDMIFSDIVGLSQFKRKVKHGYGKFSCLLRVVDSFGTEPAFNHDQYAKSHKLKTTWGMQNLNPQQFFTMFPHSPDNSFIGFVVEDHLNETEEIPQKKDLGVVYGKVENMWQGKEKYLDVVKDYVQIHGTVYIENADSETIIPKYVYNHGIMKGPDLHRMLRESKLFIGLGFPYEGPAPLEAIVQGCAYINPKFIPPHNSKNTKFFHGKPTLRKVTSQHPYAEDFIGEPHVFTVDINDPQELKAALEKALKAVNNGEVQPYMPYEYTPEGMLQRVNAYLEHQDFCAAVAPEWPPEQAITVVLANRGKSCKDTCMDKQLICEPSYFKKINKEEILEQHFNVKCQSTKSQDDIYYPAYQKEDGQCILQGTPLLFSCVGEHEQLQRLCPCRDFIKGQTALCQSCL